MSARARVSGSARKRTGYIEAINKLIRNCAVNRLEAILDRLGSRLLVHDRGAKGARSVGGDACAGQSRRDSAGGSFDEE